MRGRGIGVAVVGLVLFLSACSVAAVTVHGQGVVAIVPQGQIVGVAVVDPTTVPPVPAGLGFPLGALSVHVYRVVPGSVTRVTLVLPTRVDGVRKLIDGSWQDFADDGTTGANLSSDGTTITLDLRDGGRGDSDGLANGTIADPIAPVTVNGGGYISSDGAVLSLSVTPSHGLTDGQTVTVAASGFRANETYGVYECATTSSAPWPNTLDLTPCDLLWVGGTGSPSLTRSVQVADTVVGSDGPTLDCRVTKCHIVVMQDNALTVFNFAWQDIDFM
jgi:Neocarzinostatin family.